MQLALFELGEKIRSDVGSLEPNIVHVERILDEWGTAFVRILNGILQDPVPDTRRRRPPVLHTRRRPPALHTEIKEGFDEEAEISAELIGPSP